MSDEDEPDRAAILKRRQRMVALALAGLSGGVTGCGGGPTACLSPPFDAGPDVDAGRGDAGLDAASMPCLGAPIDAGDFDGGPPDAGG